MDMARSSSAGVAIRSVVPVLWITSYLHIMDRYTAEVLEGTAKPCFLYGYSYRFPIPYRNERREGIYTDVNAQTAPHTMRYDMRCYVNVRSKADISQPNLLHGNQKLKSAKKN